MPSTRAHTGPSTTSRPLPVDAAGGLGCRSCLPTGRWGIGGGHLTIGFGRILDQDTRARHTARSTMAVLRERGARRVFRRTARAPGGGATARARLQRKASIDSNTCGSCSSSARRAGMGERTGSTRSPTAGTFAPDSVRHDLPTLGGPHRHVTGRTTRWIATTAGSARSWRPPRSSIASGSGDDPVHRFGPATPRHHGRVPRAIVLRGAAAPRSSRAPQSSSIRPDRVRQRTEKLLEARSTSSR